MIENISLVFRYYQLLHMQKPTWATILMLIRCLIRDSCTTHHTWERARGQLARGAEWRVCGGASTPVHRTGELGRRAAVTKGSVHSWEEFRKSLSDHYGCMTWGAVLEPPETGYQTGHDATLQALQCG